MTLAKIIADFETQLATQLDPGGTTATLQSATDDDGVALPTGRYFLTIDMLNSQKEHFSCTLTGTALTNIKSVSRQGVETTGAVRKHRVGASVTLTDFANLRVIVDMLGGVTGLDHTMPIFYDGTASITLDTHLATKKYVDDTALSGAPDATLTVKGVVEIATTAEIDSDSSTGGTGASIVTRPDQLAASKYGLRLPTANEKSALVGDNTDIAVGSGNKYVTQTGLQKNSEKYAADAGSTDSYAITLSPAPTSYATGMVVYFKANTANTGAATLNVNSLGAKTIVKGLNTTLANNDIVAGQFCTVIYDGTNFVLISPNSNVTAPILAVGFSNGTTSKTGSDASTTQNIAHGLGTTPKKIRLTFSCQTATSSSPHGFAVLSYNGTTCSVVGHQYTNGAIRSMGTTTIILYGANEILYQTGTVSFDSTNISIDWVRTGDSYNFSILWEAEA